MRHDIQVVITSRGCTHFRLSCLCAVSELHYMFRVHLISDKFRHLNRTVDSTRRP